MPDPGMAAVFDSGDPSLYAVRSAQPGPAGQLPLEAADLLVRPSGDIFGWTQDVGMGWAPAELRRPEALILSTQGGVREADGTPLALGYHTGHWEVGLLVQAAAEEGARTATKATATVEVAASDALDDDAAAAIAEISRGRDGTLKVKLHDKRAALVQLGHHLGVFRPRADANEAADGLEELLRDVDGRTRGIPEGA